MEEAQRYMLECPHCGGQLQVARSAAGAKVKCGHCGEIFIGPAPAPVEPAAPAAARGKSDTARVVMILAFIFGVTGIIAMAGMLVYIRMNPTVTHKVIREGADKFPEAEATGRREPPSATPPRPAPAVGDPNRQPAGDDPDLPASDPDLDPGHIELVAGQLAQPNVTYVCGRVLNKGAAVFERVGLTVHIGRRVSKPKEYRYLPAGGTVPYSIRLPLTGLNADDVRVVATGVKAGSGVVAWSIDPDEIRHPGSMDKPVWTGRTRNRTDTSVRDVKIYCNFYDEKGVEYTSKRTVGSLTEGRTTITAGGRARFRIPGDEELRYVSHAVVARVVGRKL